MSSTTAAFEIISAAGIAPAVPRFQTGHVAATPRAEDSERIKLRYVGAEKREAETLGISLAVRLKLADPKGLAPSAFPSTTGCSSD